MILSIMKIAIFRVCFYGSFVALSIYYEACHFLMFFVTARFFLFQNKMSLF